MRRSSLTTAVVWLAAAGSIAGEATAAESDEGASARRDTVFITPVDGNLKPEVLKALLDLVVVAVGRANVMDKLTLQDVQAELEQENLKDRLKCDTLTCAAQITGPLGVRYLLRTSVSKLGGTVIVTTHLYDTHERTSRSGQGTCPDREDEYRKAIAEAVLEVFGIVRKGLEKSQDAPPFAPSVVSAPAAPSAATAEPTIKRARVTDAVGDLTVSATPEGLVRLELTDPSGKTVAVGAPYRNTRASIGRWTLVAKAKGYENQVRSFSVPPDEATSVSVDLRLLGSLSITGSPGGASVTVLGPHGFRDEGGLPWEAAGLALGDYVVEVARNGYISLRQTARVDAGTKARISVELQKDAMPTSTSVEGAKRFGFVSISTPGVSARVFVDGDEIGYSPLLGFRLPVGRHTVTAFDTTRFSGAAAEQITVTGADGRNTPQKVIVRFDTLASAQASTSDPVLPRGRCEGRNGRLSVLARGEPDCKVTVGSTGLGLSPILTKEAPTGQCEIVVICPSGRWYREIRKIESAANEKLIIDAPMWNLASQGTLVR